MRFKLQAHRADPQDDTCVVSPAQTYDICVAFARKYDDIRVLLDDILASYAAPMRIGELIAGERAGRGVTVEHLALRARVDEQTIEQIENGQLDPDPDLARRLLLVLGLELTGEGDEVSATQLRGRYDPADLAAARARPMGQRLADAFSWNRFTSSLAGTARARTP
jgi:transcriptional regulator with XRE-family HTH domain